MQFNHVMIRVKDLERSVKFWTDIMDFEKLDQKDHEQGEFTLVFLKEKTSDLILELTYNWGENQDYLVGRNFGHLAFKVDNIYDVCQRLLDKGVEINRPPRDGYMAFFKDPDNISIELLQNNEPLEPTEPWVSMENSGYW